ncbi:MAG TPA: bifunctional phosphoribosyl-AMP cyclohydrolase/phosphoribosyl-ATP diphosphatase HisIE [Candidatus Limnocylindrales bacterium]
MSASTPSSPAGPIADAARVRWGVDGLVPVVVQDASDGRMLMLAYANAESLAATLATGEVHFFSRSRGRLWRKGATSGNILRLRGLAADCDGDALLATVEPAGPACHRGTRSCFDADGAPAEATPAPSAPASAPAGQGFDWLETLWATIAERAVSRPAGSYTASLLSAGVDAPARKVAEEATEVLMAAKDDAVAEAAGRDRTALRAALAGEAADLLYHALVLLAERGLPPSAVIAALRARHGG